MKQQSRTVPRRRQSVSPTPRCLGAQLAISVNKIGVYPGFPTLKL